MTDATTRARTHTFWGQDFRYRLADRLRALHDARVEAIAASTTVLATIDQHLADAGFAIIDTRTHAAVPREPSEADVERVARAIIQSEGWSSFWAFDDAMSIVRAAIAALVQGQTQGGGREDV